MTLGFSTIGDPALTLSGADELAQAFNLDFIELRSLGGMVDLPAYFQHAGEHLSATPVRVWATSLCLLRCTDADLAEFYRCAEWARRLGVPYLRVAGNGSGAPSPSVRELSTMAGLVRELQAELSRRGYGGELLLETHDIFSSSSACLALNDCLEQPVSILWDCFHTWREGGESPAESWRQLGARVKHIHYKDGRADAGVSYVIPGAGDYPTAGLLGLLQRENYRGGISLEWERLWVPELPPLTVALPDFCRLFQTTRNDYSGAT